MKRTAVCDVLRPLIGQGGIQPPSWRCPTWLSSPRSLQLHARGIKRSSTIKANRLPQGALPPSSQSATKDVPEKEYPLVLRQHLNNILKFKDCIVLTRVGDFYEMYFDQVEQYAPLVNLKKAKRSTSLGDVPMAGFQYTQLERYLKMFVQDLGKQVAISEQVRLLESERNADNEHMLFDRKVTRVVTAGTLIDETFMDPLENNYLLAIHFDHARLASSSEKGGSRLDETHAQNTKIGLSWIDLSSGDFYTQSSHLASAATHVARIGPKEIVLDSEVADVGLAALQKLIGHAHSPIHFHEQKGTFVSTADWTPMLERAVSSDKQGDFTNVEVSAANIILDYIQEKLQGTKLQLKPPIRHTDVEAMTIDKQSLRNLEIRSTLRDNNFQGSLLHTIRQTTTKSGARLLSRRLISPSMSLSVINNRLNLAQELLCHNLLRENILDLLKRTLDTNRLLQKFSIGKGDADDLLGLARTVEVMRNISHLLHEHIIEHQARSSEDASPGLSHPEMTFLWDILHRLDLDSPSKIAKRIQTAIDEDGLNQQHMVEIASRTEAEQLTQDIMTADAAGQKLSKSSRRASKLQAIDKGAGPTPEDIWIMRRKTSTILERAHDELDKLLMSKSDLTARLRTELPSNSLTLKWSAQAGHFCHVKGKDAQGSLEALNGARVFGSTKSTKSFYLSDWTHLGGQIDDAKLRIRTEENRVLDRLREDVLENISKLRRNASVLDELDVACSSALTAKQQNLVRPILNQTTSSIILGGRHPTVNVGLENQGRSFTSNDCHVGEAEKILLITGPNMAGKSTYLRQNALITILAQTGCFVPADYAEIGLVDKIFSRVGSADNLYQDQSTFMVEMLETADILKQATARSFVIMDEVGRGTTPEGGVAIGYACLHHLYSVNKCRALFATHFHALADMTTDFDTLACYCTDVAEGRDGSWTYLHKLRKGVNRDSHALKVAKLAGMPDRAIAMAADVLRELQKGPKGDCGSAAPLALSDRTASAAD